ncbi:tail fiber assembly protein [Stenotrophomonas sp. G106K1]|uniref:tail fiber assembly protein n=1 Tax=Stenotrophomonas sp. G106K1 TaxID=3134792 RepID=UPI0030F41ED2
MYAVTESGYRAITLGMDLNPGEVRADEIPVAVLARVAAEQMRVERSRMLRATDWTQAPDSPLESNAKLAWALYRQELRDLPEKAGFPYCPMPSPPAGLDGAASVMRPATDAS